MIENFLRPPVGRAEWAADGVRVIGTAGVVVAGIGWGPVAFWVSALSLLGVYASRFLGVRPAFDIALGATLIVASWSSVLGLYTSIAGWDLLVHFVATGLLAAALFVIAQRLLVVPAGATKAQGVVFTTAFGMAAAVVWEMAEWAGHNFVDPTIFVAYNDTIGDLAAGTAGSILAGCFIGYLAAHSRARAPQNAPL
ncbi:hypothetical protein GCM10027413_17950 [Conyzicola nivalis]|uniref:DUF2238 domain-containing protein n=1 Tax=Conyzicola nivalis TaxID=1477021 RepID=A0A916SE68_9MICO|nr:hypothetical protein [Conyzicola nivalis]GGA96484.1 hypothetical protein GCM10010979_08670 [Conyzicola nivalis]